MIVADETAPAGLMVNAVACISASTGAAVTGLIGPGGHDASGHYHPGLPWAGCTVLTAAPAALAEIRRKAAAGGMVVVDMPGSAQANRVYDGYLAELAQTKPEDLAPAAASIIGPAQQDLPAREKSQPHAMTLPGKEIRYGWPPGGMPAVRSTIRWSSATASARTPCSR